MTRQIAVRLPDDLVTFLDEAVKQGKARSRAALVARALDRERRRDIAARDAAILAQVGTEVEDLDRLSEFVARTPLDDLD